jgi:hypothetical protein
MPAIINCYQFHSIFGNRGIRGAKLYHVLPFDIYGIAYMFTGFLQCHKTVSKKSRYAFYGLYSTN